MRTTNIQCRRRAEYHRQKRHEYGDTYSVVPDEAWPDPLNALINGMLEEPFKKSRQSLAVPICLV